MNEGVGQEGSRVDIDTGVLRRDRVLIQRSPVATLVMGFGTDALRSAYAQDGRLLRRLGIAEALAKAGFNSDEPRDELGRWTTEGDEAPATREERSVATTAIGASAAEDFAAVLERWGGWAFGGWVRREALAALGRFAAGAVAGSLEAAAGAITALGVLIIPTNSDTTSRGTVRDRPDISYEFDAPAGVLKLFRDGEVFYTGEMQGGAFRDDRGRVFGRLLGGNVVIDPDILPPVASQVHSEEEADARSRSTVRTDTESDEPKLCPEPTEEPKGWEDRSERTKQYQEQISGLERGLDINFRGVRFDGCEESNGTLLEAKGEGYQWAMTSPMEFFESYEGADGIMEQAESQSKAAPDRRIEWYFAEKPVADYFRVQFSEKEFNNITVFYEPYVPGPTK
jgi:hypothetical protein